MDDKYIKDIYDNLGGKEVFGEYNDYYEMITTDESYIKDVYDNMGGGQTFGEFEDFISLLKKKDTTQSDLEKSILDSSKSTEPTVSDSKEDPFLESLLEKDEEVAKVDLSKKLLGKGFSVTETGIGDALKIIDNITGEEVDIDLQPVFGIGKGKDIEKLRKLIDSSTDSKRELLSKNQYDDFVNDTEGYFQSLNKFYPGFNFETDGMTATISKDGDVISYVDIRNKSTKDFSELNKVLYDNIKDEDVSKLLDDETKEYDLIQEKIKDIESKVDISMEKSEEDIYDKDYLSKTLEYLEKKGKAIDPELKEKAKDARANKELFKKVLSDQFQNDPEALSMIEDFNNFLTLEKRDESISRAKKLAIENYFETRPDRGALMEIVNKKHKQADDEEKRILANVEQAKKDLKKMYTSIGNDLKDLSEKNPGVKIDFVTDENGVPIDLVSSKKIDGLDQIKQKIIGGIKTFSDFADKSEKDFNTLISNKENIEKIKDAAKRNYGALDMFAADVKSGYVNLIGSLVTLAGISQPGTAGVVVGLEGKEMIDKNRETMEEYFKSKRTYDEAIKEGSKFEFSYRTFGEQFANVSLAIASAGAGTSIGLSNVATQAVIATTFGASAAGSKYNEMQNRIEAASKAKQALKDLEKAKATIPVEKYLNEKYELERATKDLDLSQEQIIGAVITAGVVEGAITRYFGTVPNAFNVLKGLRTGTKDFIRNYYKTNLKAIKDAGISIAKATGQEVIEETSIDFLTQASDYLFLGDAIDISTLDDTAVMAIVTSGGMNVPSTAYGTIVTQVGASRYRSKVGKFADDINKLKNSLKDESLGGVARTLIHNKITENIKKIAEITNEMEADALAVGADGIKDLVMLKNMKDSLLKEAGVKADDTQEVVKAKIDNHLKKQKDNDFRDKLEYVSKKKNEILSDIDYDSAIDKIFGEKGREMADGLDSKLTAKEKFVEVHKNFKKGIQEQIKEEITKEEVVKEPVSTQVSPQTKVETIGELLDRPISLTELGGSKLDTPIEGVMYLDGQQVVVEDENGNITEIGNVDEISGKTLEEMGIKQQMPTVNVQKDGNIEIEGKVYNIESGRIKRDNKGNIVSVTIDQVDKPRSKTLRGRNAEDAAYQILLRKAESPEQTQRINEILEQDEEFKNELRKAEDTAKEDAAKDPEQDTREEIVKIDYFGEELEIKKSTLESTLEESKTKEGFANFNVIIPREKGNVKLGFMSLKKTADNTYEVSLSSLDMSLNLGNKAEGKGLGTMMYEKLIEYANKNGITINNSDNMNEKSSSVWKKLEKKGLVSFVDGKYTNKIVEDTREESIASPEVTIEDAPDGTFLNIEMVAGKDGREITQKEILDALPVEPLNVEVSGKTLVIQVPRKLSGSEMMKLAKDTEQDAIPQMSGKKGVLHAQSKEKMDLYGGKFVTNLFVKPKNIIKDERPKPGNRLFNEPLKAVKAIADKYYKRVFKGERPKFKGVKKIDKEFAKRISDAFEAMQDNPNDPEVKAAYEAMAKETMDQYQDFKDAGYTIEINNSEPYKNAQEMIDDLRNNKRMKIFSTESGFGDTPITDKQREENPLLRDSGVKDVNGETLLVNDIFRAVHDFYGHAELGNGFGPVGEENAWNVHARMFSPLARRAMTTETRGQNSYVNFSGINDEAFKLRDEARKLRKEGKEAEAEALVAKVYEIMKFADQKVGLLPEEFSSIEQDEASKVEEEVSKIEIAVKGDLDTQVENARKAIAEALPDVEIVIHDTREDFKKATGDIDRGSFDGKTIHINRQDAIKTTVAHEVFHALFLKNLKSDKQAMDLAERFVKALYPALSAETRKKLDNFAKMYKGKYAWLKNEERLAEFFGMLASEYDTMPKPKQNLVKRFLDRLAKMFGLKPITTTEVSDLLYTLAGKVAKGEVITEEDLPSGRLIEKPIETINRRQVGLFDVVYTEDAKREELIKNKLLTEPDSWTDFSEMYAAITSPDDMLAGTISINGKQIFEGGGGVFFVTKYGDVWASGREGTANTLVDMINDSFDKNNGRGLLVLAKGSDQKLISSVSGVDSSLAILDVMFDRGMFTATEFKEAARFGVKETVYRNELKKKVTEYKTENNLGLKDKVPADILNEFKKEARKISQSNKGDIKLGRTSGQIKKDLRKYFSDPKTSTFEVRGNVIKELLGKLAQQKTVKQNKDKIIELLGGDKSKGLGKGATPKQNSLGDLVALLAAEKLTKGLKTGDIYAIIEVKSKVKRVEDDHPSYPQHVKTVDGSKPILHLLKKRDNGFDSFTTKTNKKYKVGNVSVMSGSFNKDRKQIVGEKAVMALKKDSALELAKEMEADLKGKDYISEKDKVKSIFKATGFERGVDGKWRFEIPFGSLKVSESGDYKLSDVYVAPELYTAYPSLKDIKLKIEIQPGHRQEGFYDVNEKEVSIRVKEKGQIMRYLVHELQHDIQMKEGFAMGGTPSIVAENQDKIIDKATAFRILELKSEKEAYNSFLFLLEYVMGEFEDVKPRKLFSQEFLKENLEAEAEIATERLELYGREPSEVLSELYSELSEDLITKIEIARRDFGYDEVYSIISEIEGEITEELNKFDLFNMYERLAGEVESRNVERRLYGQIGLISSTESVSREDQLLLFKEDVFPTRKQRVEDVNKILDKQGLNTMTTEQGVDLVKALDNWAMWYEGISEYLEDNFNEYASDILAMLPPSSMNASSAATVGLSINNAERIYKGEEPKGMGSRYAKTWLEGNDIDSNKMYEFARALMGDPNGIAVDMHVWSVYKGFSTTRSPANIKQFNETKKFVLAVSEASGMEPRQVQAALWAANIIKSGNNPTSYIDIFEKHFNENGLHDRVDSWRINGYKPFSTLRIEREKALIALGKKKTIEEKFPGALFIRKQRKAGFDIIEKAKTLGISDAAIRKYFIEQGGLTLEQADELVEDYNEMMRKEGLKREGVRVISNKTLKSLDSVKKFLTSAKAYKPKSMQIGQESRDGFIEANVKKAEFYLRKLNKIAKDEEVLENLELYMRGDKSVDLPDNVAEIAFLMREHIDALSKQLINSGAVEADESVENIMNNIGSYMTRSYEVFTNKDWKNQVSDQVIQEAKNFLRKEYMEQAEFIAMKENRPVDKVLEEYVDSTVSKLLKKEEAMSYVKMANESKKSLGILKRRGDIPAPLRALMGEYKSPAQNYIISVQKVATLAAQQRFLNEMVEAGKGVWLFEKNKAPEGFRVEIATEGSKTMNPLNGLYTSKEIAEELKGSGLVDPEGIFSKAKPLYDFYQKAVGLVKFNKTILSPGTHAKNFIGNLFFMAANGYIDPKDYYTSTRVVLNDLAEGTNEVLNEKMLEYIDAGIINQSATLRDLKDMMAGKENRVDSQEDFEKRMIERFNKPNNKFVKGVKRASEIAQNMYQAEDDFFKIVAYEANKQRYAKAYHKKPFEQLNDTQKKEVLDKVKEIVKNTLPNYNRIAEVRRLIRAVPFTGTFISFHMEAIRTAANTLSLTYEELKDPRTRTIGMQRLTGIGVLFALKFTLIPMITNALVGDDDELEKSARRVLPPWSKDSNIVIESVDNGVLRYRDLSASDPWGVVDKVINAARYREDTLDGFVGVIEETLSPFVTEDILFAAIKDATSKTSKSNTTSENIDVVVNAIYKAFSPGALTSAERIFIEDKKSLMDLVAGKTLSYKKDDKTNEIVGQLTGFKSREIKLKDAAFFKFRDIASAGYGKSMPGAARNASGSYSKAWYDYTNKKISKAKLDKSYEESNKKYKEVLETTLADYKAFIKLGLSPREIKEQMKKAGFNQTEIKYISRGYIPNLKKKKR